MGWDRVGGFIYRVIRRARSIYLRALDIDYRNPTLWLKYAEMEMRNRFVNSARNVWDRAVTLLPRIDQFWYKYAYMEEMLGNVEGARKIFERWIAHKPDANAWNSFVKFEMRHDNIEHARDVFERLVLVSARAWRVLVLHWCSKLKKQQVARGSQQSNNLHEVRQV